MISIIIVSYKSQQLIKYFFKSFEMAHVSVPHEFIIVDNASHDGTKEYIEREHPQVKFVENTHNLGYATACNIGTRAANGDYLLFLNQDIVVKPGSIEALAKYLDEHTDVGMVGPKLMKPSGAVQDSCRRFPNFLTPLYRWAVTKHIPWVRRQFAEYSMQDFDYNATREVDCLAGAALMVRRAAAVAVGGWDERFFFYIEDIDLCRRLWAHNWKVVFVVRSEMFHYHGKESTESSSVLSIFFSRTTRWHLLSWLKYFQKYFRQDIPIASPSARHL